MCACVMRTASTDAALKGGSCQLRSRSSCGPWNKPQSTSTRARSDSIRYFDPVTEPAAPQNESVGMTAMLADVVSEPRAVATGSSAVELFSWRTLAYDYAAPGKEINETNHPLGSHDSTRRNRPVGLRHSGHGDSSSNRA